MSDGQQALLDRIPGGGTEDLLARIPGGEHEQAAPPDTSGFEIGKPAEVPDFEQPEKPQIPPEQQKKGVSAKEVAQQFAARGLESAKGATKSMTRGAEVLGSEIVPPGFSDRFFGGAPAVLSPFGAPQSFDAEDQRKADEMIAKNRASGALVKPVEGFEGRAGPVAKFATETVAPIAGQLAIYGTGAALAGPGLPALAAGAGMGGLQSAGSMYDRVLETTGDHEKAMKAALLSMPTGMLTGSLDAATIGKIPGLDKITKGLVGNYLLHLSVGGFGGGVQSAWDAQIRKRLGGEDLDTWEEVKRGFGQGALTVGIGRGIGAAGEALGAIGGRAAPEAAPETKAPPATEGAAASGLPERIPSGSGQGTVPQETGAGGPEEIDLGDRRAVERPGQPERRQNADLRQKLTESDQEAALKALRLHGQGDELGALAVMQEQNKARTEAVAAAHEEARTDALTGLPNKRQWAERDLTGKSVFSGDLDGLKWVNDNLGHEAGNKYLQKVAEVVRQEDPEGKVARVGGDEFNGEGDSRPEAEELAKRIQDRLANTTVDLGVHNGQRIVKQGIGISFGHGETEGEADKAMYENKAQRAEQGLRRADNKQEPPGIVRTPEAETPTEPGAAAETSPIRPAAAEPIKEEAAAPTSTERQPESKAAREARFEEARLGLKAAANATYPTPKARADAIEGARNLASFWGSYAEFGSKPPPETYFRGDRAVYTGETTEDGLHQVLMLEGQDKGHYKVVSRAPDGTDATAGRKQAEWLDQQAQFRKLHEPAAPPPPEGDAGGEKQSVYQKPSTNPRFPGMSEAQARYLSNAWPGYEAPLSEQVKGPLYHETSLAGARALLQRTEGKTAVSHTGLATSDNPDLALGQGGRGVRLEFDSSKAVGAENKSKPGLAYTKETGGGSEYNVSASVRGIVRAIEVKSKMTLAALKRTLGDRFDFDNAQKTEYGWRVERKTAEPKGEAESPGLFKKPPESKQAGALDLFGGRKPPPPAKDVREPDSEGYQHIDEYLANKQLAEQTIDRNAITYKQRIRDAGEDVDLAGRALDPYAALKIKGEAAYDAMSKVVPENERDAYEYAKTAPPEVKAVWDQMLKDKEALGEHGEANIPDFQRRENYTMQAWKPLEGEKGSAGTGRPKFGLSTPREESRTFPTVLEGWAAGRERAMPDGFANYVRSGKQLTSSIEARRLLDTLKKSEIAGTEPQPGWKRIESSKLFDSAEFRTPEGETVKLSLPTYAEPKTADALNKIIATSKLQGIGPVETMKRLNNAYRASIFYTGLFHPRQFIVREILSSPTLFKNPFREYRRGLDAIQKWDDQTQLLVKGGLRLFNPQDFTPALDAEKGRFEKAVDAVPGGTKAKEALKSFGDTVRRFTFERLGAAYKLMGAKAELSAWQTRHADELRQGTLTLEDGAKAVAAAHNDLWGGQNWERILLDEKGLTSKLADPTMKDLVGLALNTPDWTTSKLRLFVKAFERGEGADVRRLMWARTIGRAAAATIGANVMMSLFDDKDALDRYKEAWKNGPLHLADVDWTPLHDAVFGKDPKHMRHYFGVVGALSEPLSWMVASDKEGKHFDPIKGPLQHLRYRESLMGKLVNDALEGSDPIGRAFTGTGEMTGIEDRGRYKSSGPGRYKGMKKESLAGQFNSYKSKYQDKAGPVNFDELPSFVMGETLGAMPVQLQAAYAKMLGQLDWSAATARALGLDVSQAAPKEPKKSKAR